jgi:antitoxin ParD1/3/4
LPDKPYSNIAGFNANYEPMEKVFQKIVTRSESIEISDNKVHISKELADELNEYLQAKERYDSAAMKYYSNILNPDKDQFKQSMDNSAEVKLSILALPTHLLPFFAISVNLITDKQRKCLMQSMNVSLPEPLKKFVDEQIAQGRYSSASEYMRELIRADEKRKAEEQLETKLLEGLNSQEIELTSADWNIIRKEALTKLKEKKQIR